MCIDVERLRFEASERALKNEMERNPIECMSCSNWAWGGNMSYQIFHCTKCGQKRAQQPTRGVIKTIASERGISWDEAWDFAKELHDTKTKCGSGFYADEYYFADDLYKHHKKTRKKSLKDKYIIGVDPAEVGKDFAVEVTYERVKENFMVRGVKFVKKLLQI